MLIPLSLLLITIYLSSSTISSLYSTVKTQHQKSLFVENFLAYESNMFHNSSLIFLCRDTTWQPGLIFKCEVPLGGVINIRNLIFNCVWYTILAGGKFSFLHIYFTN
jgi:hypothetical protein